MVFFFLVKIRLHFKSQALLNCTGNECILYCKQLAAGELVGGEEKGGGNEMQEQ